MKDAKSPYFLNKNTDILLNDLVNGDRKIILKYRIENLQAEM